MKGGLIIDTKAFIDKHLKTGIKLHTLCDHLGLSRDQAKLLTYLHIKIEEQGGNLNYFDKPCARELNAIEILLGKEKFPLLDQLKRPQDFIPALSSLRKIPQQIQSIDRKACCKHGLEFYVASEIHHRHRFYTDEDYRKEILTLYQTKIRPKLSKNES